MKTLLITVASGFLGNSLVIRAKQLSDYKILGTYHNVHKNLDKDIKWIKLNLPLLQNISKGSFGDNLSPDIIIHASAISNPSVCEDNPELAYKVNFLGTKKLADFAKQVDALFVFISSDLIFDGTKPPYSERSQPSPINVYAETKVRAEEYIQQNINNYIIIRPSLIYGLTSKNNFLYKIYQSLLDNSKIFLFSDEYRTPIWVDNLADAILDIITSDFRSIINIGGAEVCNRVDFARKFAQALEFSTNNFIIVKQSEMDFNHRRSIDTSFDISLARKVLTVPLLNLEQSFLRIKVTITESGKSIM